MKRALFGGTFDPPHLAHTQLAALAVAEVGLDEVIFLPCHQSPHKQELPQASDADRLAMLRLATQGLAWAKVSDWELRRAQRSFSWETAEHFAAAAPGEPLYWILGVDQWRALEKWSHPEKLAELLTFIVLGRGGEVPDNKPGWRGVFLPGQIPGSGTEIREQLARNGEVRGVLHPEVIDFIRRKNLYRSQEE